MSREWPKYDPSLSWEQNWESAGWDCEARCGHLGGKRRVMLEQLSEPFTKYEASLLASMAAGQPHHVLARFGEAVPKRLVLFLGPAGSEAYRTLLDSQGGNKKKQRADQAVRDLKAAEAKCRRLVKRKGGKA